MFLFGRRPDGKKVKGLDGVTRFMPHIMPNREGSTNYLVITIPVDPIEEYIAAKKTEGIELNFRDVAIALLVRWFKIRPKLNRFIVAGRYYQRNHVDFSMMVHKNLRTGENETVVKMRFSGDENMLEIKQQIDAKFEEAIVSTNNADEFSGSILKLPHFLNRFVGFWVKILDRWGMLTDKFLRDTSPFHSSIFFSDMKSIHMDYIHHHLYNFGTCSFFAALGKEKYIPVVDQKTGELSSQKVVELGISVDDRSADGLYWAQSLRKMYRMIDNLSCLDRAPTEGEISRIRTPKEIKAERKKLHSERKMARKKAKREFKKTKRESGKAK